MNKYTSKLLLSSALVGTFTLHANAQEDVAFDLGTIIIEGKLISVPWYRLGTSFEQAEEDDLKDRPALENAHDVMSTAANVTAPEATAKAATVRGVDGTGPAENANAFFAGSRPRLGFTIDGRPAGYNELVFGNHTLWDVDNIAILRGPQSTLAGRNAISGTVAITTNEPTFEREGKIEVSAGTQEQRRVSAMANIPVSENLAFRFAADVSKSQSTVDYTSFVGVDEPGERETRMLRGKMLANLDIADGATLKITAEHNSHFGPNAQRVVRPFADRISQFPQQPVHKVTTNSLSTDFEVDLNDSARSELNASIADSRFDRYAVPDTSNAWITSREFSIDPRMRFYGPNGIEALVGLHYYKADQDEFIEFVSDQRFKDKTETKAIYAEINVPFAEAFEFSLGGRYEQERRKRSGGDAVGAIAAIDRDRAFEAFLPRIGLNWNPIEGHNYGFQVSKGYNAVGGGIATGAPNPFPIVYYEYDTETVWNYEIYGRQELMGGRFADDTKPVLFQIRQHAVAV